MVNFAGRGRPPSARHKQAPVQQVLGPGRMRLDSVHLTPPSEPASVQTGDPEPHTGSRPSCTLRDEQDRDPFLGCKLDTEAPGSGLPLGPTRDVSTGCRPHATHQRSVATTAPGTWHRSLMQPPGDQMLVELKSGQHTGPQCKS